MAILTLPILFSLAAMLASIGKWFLEIAVVYGKKIAFFSVAVSLFFAILYTVSTALFATFNEIGGSNYFASVSPYLGLVTAIFPGNFLQLSSLIMSIEFQIFFWRWAMKVLDLKVNFFS